MPASPAPVEHMTMAELQAELADITRRKAWRGRYFEVQPEVARRGTEAWRCFDVFGTPEAETIARSDAIALDRRTRNVILARDHNGHVTGEIPMPAAEPKALTPLQKAMQIAGFDESTIGDFGQEAAR